MKLFELSPFLLEFAVNEYSEVENNWGISENNIGIDEAVAQYPTASLSINIFKRK